MNRVSIVCHSALAILPWHLKPYHNLHYVVHAGKNDTIQYIFERVVERTKILKGKKFTDLRVYAHGKGGEASLMAEELAQMSFKEGGFGMRLGKEVLNLANLELSNVLENHFEQIILYNCQVARTSLGLESTLGDGQRFCGELAIRTKTEVIASSDNQYYSIGNGNLDMGEWEGTVYKFSPIDGSSKIYIDNSKPYSCG